MWLAYTLLHFFFLALVNYIDEYLSSHTPVPNSTNIHTKIGGLLLISTLMSFMGAAILGFVFDVQEISHEAFFLSILSAIPMVAMFATYFYLLTIYPVHQIEPLFQLSSVWLLIIELSFGESVSIGGFGGIVLLLVGSYFLASGTFKLQTPVMLFLIAIPATSTWAIALYMVRVASSSTQAEVVTFWQYLTIGVIGILLLVFVGQYRQGFVIRIKYQGKRFLGLSLLNESFAQSAYVFSTLAVAIAPIAAFVTAMAGVQYIFLIGIFFLFPLSERSKITRLQIFSILLIGMGVFSIEWLRTS